MIYNHPERVNSQLNFTRFLFERVKMVMNIHDPARPRPTVASVAFFQNFSDF